MATDRELLQNLKSIIDAQLGLNVIPAQGWQNPPPGSPAANMDPMALSILTAGHESSPGGPPPANVPVPDDRTGFVLTPGHPRVNVQNGGQPYAYVFSVSEPKQVRVYYEIVAGSDSGSRVTAWLADGNGAELFPKDTRVVANDQPFQWFLQPGAYQFVVQTEITEPIGVGMV